MKKTILGVSLMILSFVACKKDETTPAVVAKADVRDSVYYLATELYLWREQLPTVVNFKPTSYATAEDAMTKVRTYSPLGSTGKNVDRWSFAMKKSDWDNVASGNNGDFGCGFRFASADNTLYISYVYAKSSAGVMGLQRGFKVLKINGVTATSDNITSLNTELGKSSLSLDVEKPDASKATIVVSRMSYATNPVLAQNIVKQGTKNVGYLAFNSFLGTTAEKEINDAFTYFKTNGVSELVVDLRYNGGGYVSLAELLANLIAPASAAGKLMYQDTHNAKYSGWNKTKNFEASPNQCSQPQQSRVYYNG
jgi:C-terminal processing protease CtpA/Prc